MTLKFDFLVVQIVLAHLFYLSMIQWWREAMIGECVHAMPCTMRNTQGLMATQKWWFFFHVEFVEREILLLVERSIPYLWKYSEKGNMIPLVCSVILIIIIGEMDMFDSLIPCTHHFPISMIFFFCFWDISNGLMKAGLDVRTWHLLLCKRTTELQTHCY
jgi:hypothetical protein